MHRKHTFFLILITTAICLPKTNSKNIPLNSNISTLNPTQTWTSPNNTFTLKFIPKIPLLTYTLSITYKSSTPIWSVPSSIPINRGSFLHFHPSGNLILFSPSNLLLWQSNTSNLNISHATLDQNGNFLLLNLSNYVIWSTFSNPTDTVVPGMDFNVGMVLSSGFYSFFINSKGVLSLEWNNTVNYYNFGLNSSVSGNLSGNPRLVLQDIGTLSVIDDGLANSSVIVAYSSDYGENGGVFRVLRLDDDGNLRIYSVDSGNEVNFVRWSAVGDQCEVFGYCGNMGICSYNDTGPVCGCPSQNFDAVDGEDGRKGCVLKRDVSDCPGDVALLEMEHTRFLNYPPEMNDVYYVGGLPCRGNCLSGSTCVAATTLSDGSGECYIKSSKFVSGYRSAALPSTSYVKVCGPVLPNVLPSVDESGEGKGIKRWVVIVAVLISIVLLIIVEGGLWLWCCRRSSNFGSLSSQYSLLEYASGAPVQFSYRELQQATRGFKEKLGVGGFGTVYKGVLANRTIAGVKQLEGIEQGEKQFRMEVATISSTHHLNLVRLIGFCSEGRHRLLVYEFMKNGSLDSLLFGTDTSSGSGKFLSWERRFDIALGTAKGITYLHEECRDCIVHCDIKPENILLDDNYIAKVSDFGLAKLVNSKDQRYRTLTSVRGTRGYLAPEWLADHPITSKSDVYSFGMVLLELVSGKRNFDVSDDTNRKKFTTWAYEEFDKGNVTSIVDRRLDVSDVDMDQVTRVVRVSFWCIQEQPSQRPMMGKVVQMLEGIMEIKRPSSLKTLTSGSISGSINGLSNFAISGHGQSSSSSLPNSQKDEAYLSGMNIERSISSLVLRDT